MGRSGPAGSVSGTATVELFLAGTFRVVRDGVQLTDGEIGSRKSRTLLKLLAVERPGLVTVDRIVEILWPDERPASPEQNVAIMVSRLRAVLGAELIQGGRAGYRLAAGPGLSAGQQAYTDKSLESLRWLFPGESTSTQISGACGKHWRFPSSLMRCGEAHATSAARTPSAVEIGHSVSTRPWRVCRPRPRPRRRPTTAAGWPATRAG